MKSEVRNLIGNVHRTRARRRVQSLWAGATALLMLTSAGCAIDPGATPSNTPLASERTYPEAPLLDRVVDCMHEKGWEVIVGWESGYTGPEMNADLSSQWITASNECAEAAGYFDPQLNTAQIKELYHQEVATHECIVALRGASDQPPSEQTYIDTYRSASQYYAIAAVLAAQLPQSETKRIAEKCVPPTWFLNVSGL